VSLISEALRKTRQESADKGSQSGIVVRHTLVLHPRGGRRGLGLVLMAVLAAGAGAALTWWLVESHRVAPVASAHAASTPAPAVRSDDAPRSADADASRRDGHESGARAAAAPSAAVPVSGSAQRTSAPPGVTAPAGASAAAPTTAARTDAEAPTRSAINEAGGRVFTVSADLGYAKLVLDFIAYRPHGPFAGINGNQVGVGSVVEGFTVEEIGADHVTLRDARGTLVLRAH
jgi:hypothetical protein